MSNCPTCGRVEKRSSEQNRRYWLLLAKIGEEVKLDAKQFSPETWHEQCKRYWLGKTDIELPSGEVITRANSTTDLDVSEFNDYMTQVEHWAGSKHGVYLDE